MSFIEKLDALMKERNINKSQLSKESGIPYTTIDGFYKKGTDNIKLSTLKKLSSYFGCSLDYLVDDDVQAKWSFDDASQYIEDRLNSKVNAEIETIAAHHDSDEWTDAELAEIEEFKKFVLSKRK